MGPQKQPASVNQIQAQQKMTNTELRLAMGEAYMFCEDCGAKLYSFDGNMDASKRCPYMKHGKCSLD
jgi:hypothetical protein